MRRVLFVGLALILFASLANAQVPAGNVFFGYSYYNTDVSPINRANTNGFEASLEGRIVPFLGFVADFDGHYGSQNFPTYPLCPVGASPCFLTANVTEHNYLFGPRVSFPVGRVRPFVEALFGGAHISLTNGGGSDTSFATAVGGGLDYKLIPLLAWRIQGDYVQTRFFDNTQNNVRISTGIVLRF
jgi:opacity protein-like surface antigen